MNDNDYDSAVKDYYERGIAIPEAMFDWKLIIAMLDRNNEIAESILENLEEVKDDVKCIR